MYATKKICTGDIIFTNNNELESIIQRCSTGKHYIHCGIAVRFIDKSTISLTEEGELYIFHMTNYINKDDINGERNYVRFTKFEKIYKKCDTIAYRPLKTEYRNEKLISSTIDFYNKYKKYKFPYYNTLISLVFDIRSDTSSINNKILCSELVAHYYLYSIDVPHIITNVVNDVNEKDKLKYLFGDEAPISMEKYNPGIYSAKFTPNSNIFGNEDIIVYSSVNNDNNIMIKSLILIIILILIILIIGFYIKKKFN